MREGKPGVDGEERDLDRQSGEDAQDDPEALGGADLGLGELDDVADVEGDGIGMFIGRARSERQVRP